MAARAERDDYQDAAMYNLAECYARDVRDEEGAKAVVGDELSIPRLAAMPGNFRSLQQDVATLSITAALCAEVQLYFPAASTSLAPAFTPELAKEYALIVPPPPVPVRATERPGRNELCACGSGKKFKRCHGAN